jgi:hypothetical protein
VAALVVASVVGAVLAIPHGTAAERIAEAARIQDGITAAFEFAGVAPDEVEFWTVEEPSHFILPEPWKGTISAIRVATRAAVEPADVIAALSVATKSGVTWVGVESATAAHTVAFSHGSSATVAVTSQTSCCAK